MVFETIDVSIAAWFMACRIRAHPANLSTAEEKVGRCHQHLILQVLNRWAVAFITTDTGL
jgi:hypothetical protein